MTTIEVKRPVLFCGENPGMTLYSPGTERAVAIVSYWNCTDSVHGVGHALVLWLAEGMAQTTGIGQGWILTDNLDLAQVLVETLTRYFPEFQDVSIENSAYIVANCEHTFGSSCYRVMCQGPKMMIEVEWRSILDRKQIMWPRFPAGEAAYDLTTVICPCRIGHIQMNGQKVDGEARVAQAADGKLSSSAFLAFAETWVGPLEG